MLVYTQAEEVIVVESLRSEWVLRGVLSAKRMSTRRPPSVSRYVPSGRLSGGRGGGLFGACGQSRWDWLRHVPAPKICGRAIKLKRSGEGWVFNGSYGAPSQLSAACSAGPRDSNAGIRGRRCGDILRSTCRPGAYRCDRLKDELPSIPAYHAFVVDPGYTCIA